MNEPVGNIFPPLSNIADQINFGKITLPTVYLPFRFFVVLTANRRLNRHTKLLIGFKIDLRLFEEKFYGLFAQNYNNNNNKKIFLHFYFTIICCGRTIRIT